MPKRFHVFNMDFVLTEGQKPEDQEIKLLECGSGICNVGYLIDTHEKEFVHDNIFNFLSKNTKHIYIVNLSVGLLQRSFSKDYLNQHPNIVLVPSIEVFIRGIQTGKYITNESVVVVDRQNAQHQLTEVDVAAILKRFGITIPVVSDSSFFRMALNKIMFSAIMSRWPNCVPTTYVIDEHNYEAELKSINASHAEWFIIKYTEGSRAQGAVIVDRKEMDATVRVIFTDNLDAVDSLSIKESQKERLKEHMRSRQKGHCSASIIQEYVKSKLITIQDKGVNKSFINTGRMVLGVIYDEVTDSCEVELISTFSQLAKLPLDKSDILTNDNAISAHISLPKGFDLASGYSVFSSGTSKNASLNNEARAEHFDAKTHAFIAQYVKQYFTPLCRAMVYESAETLALWIMDSPQLIAQQRALLAFLHLFNYAEINKTFYSDLQKRGYANLASLILIRMIVDINRFNLVKSDKIISTDAFHELVKYKNSYYKDDESRQKLAAYADQYVQTLVKDFNLYMNLKRDYSEIFKIFLEYILFDQPSQLIDASSSRVESKLSGKELVQRHMQLALKAFNSKEYKVAVAKIKEAISILETCSPNGIDLMICYSNLSSFYRDSQQFQSAIEAARLALELRKKSSTPDFDAIEKINKKLHFCVQKLQEKLIEAENHFKNGRSYFDKKHYENASVCWKEALNIYKEERADEEKLTLCYSNLASCYRDMCQYDKALEYANKAYTAREKNHGKEDVKLLSIKKKIEDIRKLKDNVENEEKSPLIRRGFYT